MKSSSTPLVFMSATSMRRWPDKFSTAYPTANWALLETDGTITMGQVEPNRRNDIDPSIAWLNADIFAEGHLDTFADVTLNATKLELLQFSGSGIDLEPVWSIGRKGVTVATSRVSGPAISDYVLRCGLDSLQDAGAWRMLKQEGTWKGHEFIEMTDSMWLVVGFGAIGREVCRKAKALGARVVAVRRQARPDPRADEVISLAGIMHFVDEADVIVLCLPANRDTDHLVDYNFYERMKSAAGLINVGRGNVLDENELIRALDRREFRRAYLDVAAVEPLPLSSPLWAHPSIELSPHSSAAGSGRHARAAQAFCGNLALLAAGEQPDGVASASLFGG